jgi:hypothetical protein
VKLPSAVAAIANFRFDANEVVLPGIGGARLIGITVTMSDKGGPPAGPKRRSKIAEVPAFAAAQWPSHYAARPRKKAELAPKSPLAAFGFGVWRRRQSRLRLAIAHNFGTAMGTIIIPSDRETKLTRKAVAEALTAAGFPVSRHTLATKATRGGGPRFSGVWARAALFLGRLLWRLPRLGARAAVGAAALDERGGRAVTTPADLADVRFRRAVASRRR